MGSDGWDFQGDSEKLIDSDLGDSHGVFDRENDIFRDLDELADKGEILGSSLVGFTPSQ